MRQEEIKRIKEGTQTAFLLDKAEYPNHTNKSKIILKVKGDNEILKLEIKNVYTKKLVDLTFEDVGKLGYSNPNSFIRDYEKYKGKFDGLKNVDVLEFELIENKI